METLNPMKKFKIIVLSVVALTAIGVLNSFTESTSTDQKSEVVTVQEDYQNQTVNLFVTHGHCSTPFAGKVDSLIVIAPIREDQGNPIESLEISFQINPETFNVCASDDLTAKIKTPGLFIGKNNERIIFRSTNVYTMGLDWYQINGKMSIKGVEKEVKFFATGIRDPKESRPSALVLEGRMNLLDWGIDYDKIVNGKSDPTPTKWLHVNMKVKVS